MKIFQTADLHLGRRRLDGRLPDTDLLEAFAFIANEAIIARADVFLLVGDLFDKPQVEPRNLRQAQQVLAQLKRANIPVIAIEGNHDKTSLHSSSTTWINYLAEDNLVILLRTIFDYCGPHINAWSNDSKVGSFFDICGVRFVGAGYLGAATPYRVKEIVSQLDSKQPQVLLLHAGPDYFVGEGGGLSASDLSFLRKNVNYLALGHIHKPMLYGNWACNSGSPENCELRESKYDLDQYGHAVKRGYVIIDIDPNNQMLPININQHSNPRRPVHSITLDCTSYGSKPKDVVDALTEMASKLIRENCQNSRSIVDLKLTGRINFSHLFLDQVAIEKEIEQRVNIATVVIDASDLNLKISPTPSYDNQIFSSRKELEKMAILRLLNNHDLFGIYSMDNDFVSLIHELKEGVYAQWSADKIADHIYQSHLIDQIIAINTIESQKKNNDYP